jgi:putative two-component system response regulator
MSKSGNYILVVDDSSTNNFLCKSVLEEVGNFNIKLAFDGAEALRIVEKQAPDLIVLDIMMPEKDGYAVLEELKANPTTESIPVIVVSALNDIESKNKAMDLGALGYVEKPISVPLLLEEVEKALAPKE